MCFRNIAIHQKPHTVLRRLAVQMRTVFGGAPCLKLSVDGYKLLPAPPLRGGAVRRCDAYLFPQPFVSVRQVLSYDFSRFCRSVINGRSAGGRSLAARAITCRCANRPYLPLRATHQPTPRTLRMLSAPSFLRSAWMR